jgi:hypothetical protein
MAADITRSTFHPEKHYSSVRKQQGRVDLDADWNEQNDIQAHRFHAEVLDVIGASGVPQGNSGFSIQVANNNLVIGTGRFYVDGILCENEQPVAITAQPDLPKFTLPAAQGSYFAHLHVWQRDIIALQDPAIREVALGGPDTCTRTKTVWQVALIPAVPVSTNAILTCSSATDAWTKLIGPSTGQLAARSQPDPTSTDPCLVPSRAGYRRLENQLYRVEIHDDSNAPNGSTFKWSRDNGSVVTRLLSISGLDFTVSSTGPDTVLGFADGQWVELTDDTHELNGIPGTLVRLVKVAGQTLTIDPASATGSVNAADFPSNPLLRRWDSAGRIAVSTASWTDLEDGVQVQFSAGTLRTGDYWLIPARTLTGDVEWPRDTANNPVGQTPKGISHHYCRLAIVQFDGQNWHLISDCRPSFPPLTTISTGIDPGIHITDVRSNRPDASLPNDSLVPLDEFIAGFSVLVDAPVSPDSVKQPTCFVTLDIPFPLGITQQSTDFPVVGFVRLVLPGFVAASSDTTSNRILWRPLDPKAAFVFLQGLFTNTTRLNAGNRVLGRFTLKGNFIWGQSNPSLYLDGEVFGVPAQDASGPRTNLGLPGGNGRRGGDFEMWFWLQAPVALTAFTLGAQSVPAGGSVTGILTLNEPAPASGSVVTLSATALDAAGAQVPGVQVVDMPANITVPSGNNTAQFTIRVHLRTEGATVTVTATCGAGTFSASFKVITGIVVPVHIPATPILNAGGNR